MQAQILDLILDLQAEFDSAVIIITHDLGVVAELADDILVMYAGRASSTATAARSSRSPQHPYTWGLLGSMPRFDRERADRLVPIPGSPPSLINLPSGCPFHPRCRYGSGPAGGRHRASRAARGRRRGTWWPATCRRAERRRIFDEEMPSGCDDASER